MSKKREYYVDIQFTTELTFSVEARSRDEAEKKARKLYDADSNAHINSEVFDSEVTNVESVSSRSKRRATELT